MSALEDIAAERRRQIEVEGWTPEHDDEHSRGEMAAAACCYADPDPCRCQVSKGETEAAKPPSRWPWRHRWWKPRDKRRDLVRAGALIVAEIERFDRAESGKSNARTA